MLLFLLFSTLVLNVFSKTLYGKITTVNDESFDISTVIKLDQRRIHVQKNGEFEIHDVEKGNYILQVSSAEYSFPRVRIIVDDTTSAYEAPLGTGFDSFGSELSYPLHLKAYKMYDYSQKKSEFSIQSVFGNPMLLMSLVTMGALFLIPKLKDSLIDPEMQRELENMKKKKGNDPQIPQLPDIAASLTDWLAPPKKQK